MSVSLVLITVTLMLSVPTPLVASSVPVTLDTVEMDAPVWVSSSPRLNWGTLTLTIADINECTTGAHNCDTNAACTNTPGSFICACNFGYSGNGRTCMGK